nr:MAG TPA: hypothetical protein [Crassvirales sp.]DAV77040.1 MAG TPA: hypothetical protein [Caudoviricetes sp.]
MKIMLKRNMLMTLLVISTLISILQIPKLILRI